ncbi:MAG: SDR family NAD(P)-dependent oxidoreductase, partial [Candidatus Sungiibacteriota bacterium]
MQTLEKIFSVRDKVVIITGGAGMLGLEYAKALSSAGARVVLFDVVDDPQLSHGVNALYRKVDIAERDAVFAAVAEIEKEYGRIDVLINNAAVNPVPGSTESKDQFLPYEDYPEKLWNKELAVGLSGA